MNLAFAYRAKGALGEVAGTIYAERAAFARARLRKMGLIPKSVRLAPIDTVFGSLKQGFDEGELEQFYRYFSRLESKGAPRASSIADAVHTTGDVRLKGALGIMSEAIGGSGMSVGQAMTLAGFPPRDCDLIKNVESAAGIDKVLISLADELKRSQDIKRNINKLLLMPTLIYFVASVVLYLNIVFIAPKIHGLFQNVLTNVELPGYALAYYEGTAVFNANLLVSTVLYVAGVLGIAISLKSDYVKSLVELLKPVRIARQKSDYAALWGSFSLLYFAGMHREEICRGLANAAATRDARACFLRMGKFIRDGREIDDSVALARFPLFIINAVTAAHKSSSLVEGTKELSEKLIIDVEVFADKASKWVSVLVTLAIATFIALFAMLTIVPMLSAIFSSV